MAFLNRNKQQLEEALKKLDASQKHIQALEADIQTIGQSAAILTLSPDGHIDHASDYFLELTGYTYEALTGQHHRVMCDDDYVNSESYRKFWQDLVIGQRQQGRFSALDGEGNLIWLHACYSPIRGDNGMTQRIIGTVSHISGGTR